jgi:hypothetical protein
MVFWLQVAVNEHVIKSKQAEAEEQAKFHNYLESFDGDWQDLENPEPSYALASPTGVGKALGRTESATKRESTTTRGVWRCLEGNEDFQKPKSEPQAELTPEKAPFAYQQVQKLWDLLDSFDDEAAIGDNLSRAELNFLSGPAFNKVFEKLDENGDGNVSGNEWVAFWEKRLKSFGRAKFIVDMSDALKRTSLILEAFQEAAQDEDTMNEFNKAESEIHDQEEGARSYHMKMGAGIVVAVAVMAGVVMWFTRKK